MLIPFALKPSPSVFTGSVKAALIICIGMLLVACGGGSGGSGSGSSGGEQRYETFAKSYGSSLNDNFAAVNETTIDGQAQFVVAGNLAQSYQYDVQTVGLRAKGRLNDSGAMWLAGLTLGGDYLWQQAYKLDSAVPVGGDVTISQVSFDGAGGYWLAGSVRVLRQSQELFVQRLDAAGNISVTQPITLTAEDAQTRLTDPDNGWAIEATSIEPTSNGDLLVMAELRGVVDVFDGTGDRLGSVLEYHTLLVRVDSNGNLIWSAHLPVARDRPHGLPAIAELASGVIVASADDFLAGYSATGGRLWQQQATVRQMEASVDGNFLVLSQRDDDFYIQKFDPSGQPVSNEHSLSQQFTYDYLDRTVTFPGIALSFAESCAGANGCEIVTHSDIASRQHGFQDRIEPLEKRTLRRFSINTGQLLQELVIGDPGMWIQGVFYDDSNNRYQVVTTSPYASPPRTRSVITLFTFTPDLVLESRLSLPESFYSPAEGQGYDIRDAYAGRAEKWLQWDAVRQRLFVQKAGLFFQGIAWSRGEVALRSRVYELLVANTADLSLPIQSIKLEPNAYSLFKVDQLISAPSHHYLLARNGRINSFLDGSQSILNIDNNGQILWQKNWLLPFFNPPSGSKALLSLTDDALLVAGQDINQAWGGLLTFQASDGSVSIGQNVLPTDHQFTGSYGILSAASAQARFLAAESGPEDDQSLWLTQLDNNGAIDWQYTYKFQNPNATLNHPGQPIKVQLHQLVAADNNAIYLLGINPDDADFLTVIKLNVQGEVLWSSQYRLGANEQREIEAVRAAASPEGGLVIAVTETHADLDPNEVEGSGICNISDEYKRSQCIQEANIARRIETGYANITLLKLDSSGDAEWTQRYGALFDEGVADISTAIDGGYIIAGRSDSLGELGEAMLIRVDDQGIVTDGCQLNRPATLAATRRSDIVPLRSSYSSVPVDYVANIEDANFVSATNVSPPVIARSCSGIATDPTDGGTPLEDGDLLITIFGNGTVSSTPAGISCPGDCSESYAEGVQLQLQALPDAGWVFDGWSGDAGCGSQLTMPRSNQACVAEFSQVAGGNVTLTMVIQGGPGAGEINSSESPVPNMQCVNSAETETTCTAVYPQGAAVDLQARSFSNSNIGWSGCDEYGATRCLLTMNQNRTVTALFTEQQTYVLTLNVVGSGSLVSKDELLNCRGENSGICTMSYLENTGVILDFLPGAIDQLASWGGDCAPSFGTESNLIVMDSDRSCSAEFTGPSIGEYSLCTRITNETGAAAPGVVLRSLSGRPNTFTAPSLECQYYSGNTSVDLTPQANAGYGFYRWEGFGCYDNMVRSGDTHQAVTTIDPPGATCTAVFRDDVNRLGVTFGGGFSERGDRVESVTPSGGGYSLSGSHLCEEDCNEPALTDMGQDVWLRAVPINTGRVDLAGWIGCDELSADPAGGPQLCRIIFQQSVGEQRDVTVNFTHFAP